MIRYVNHAHNTARRKPRASGDDPGGSPVGGAPGPVNPARAGMIPNQALDGYGVIRKPRASGDDPAPGYAGVWGNE